LDGRPVDKAAIKVRAFFIPPRCDDKTNESEVNRSGVSVAVSMVEENSKAGAFVLFGSPLEVDDATGNEGAGAEQAGGTLPIQPRLRENRGSASEFARIERDQELGLERNLRVDAVLLFVRRMLGATRHDGAQKKNK
jgi:hypothetical protein